MARILGKGYASNKDQMARILGKENIEKIHK
jgi:hypothetical protein